MAGPIFRSEDDEAQFCLGVLRDGTPDAQMIARERLGAIFMRRGLFAEAVEAYELNVRAGARAPELFEQLSAAYRQIGEHAAADAALAEAQRVRAIAAPARVPAPEATPTPAPQPPTGPTGPAVPVSPSPAAHAPAPTPAPLPTAPGQAVPSGPVAPPVVPAPIVDPTAASGAPPASPGPAPRVVPFPTLPPPAPAEQGDDAAATGDDADAADDPRSPAALRADRDRDRWLGLGPVQAAPSAPPVAPPYGPPSRLPSHWGVIDTVLLSEAEAGASARSGHTAPRPLAVLGAVIFLMLLPIMLLALVVVNPVALYLEGRAAGPMLATDTATPPAPIKVAPGATTAWYIQDGRSVSGLWATPGLELTFDQEVAGIGRTVEVTAARPQTWGETITIVERRGQGRSNQATLLTASLDSPATLPPVGTVLRGRIVGPVTAPRLSESSQFATTTETLDLPVQLLVVPAWELWADRFVHAYTLFFHEDRWLLVTIAALLTWCVLAGGAALVFRIGRR
jgi:hypothetical protein